MTRRSSIWASGAAFQAWAKVRSAARGPAGGDADRPRPQGVRRRSRRIRAPAKTTSAGGPAPCVVGGRNSPPGRSPGSARPVRPSPSRGDRIRPPPARPRQVARPVQSRPAAGPTTAGARRPRRPGADRRPEAADQADEGQRRGEAFHRRRGLRSLAAAVMAATLAGRNGHARKAYRVPGVGSSPEHRSRSLGGPFARARRRTGRHNGDSCRPPSGRRRGLQRPAS